MGVGGINGRDPVQGDLEVHAAAAPAAAGQAAPAASLGIGARGPAVKALQEKLLAAGITVPGGADGIFGRGTASAVAAFQKAAGLPTTGVADAATLAALEKKLAGQGPAAGAGVSAIQLRDGDGTGSGPKVLTATIGGKTVKLADDALSARIFAGGRYVAWTSPQGAGGFENEGQGVHLYDAKTGKTTKVMSEYFMVDDLRYAKLPDGKEVLLASMTDGGIGMPRVGVIDVGRGGECARIDGARVKKLSGSTMTVDVLKVKEGEIVAAGTKTYDLAKLLRQPIMHNKREPM
jgi:peptidoglycan hydrolase-like protein with peptidoglycan-binding domain